MKYEAFHNSRKKPFLRYQNVDNDTETTNLPQEGTFDPGLLQKEKGRKQHPRPNKTW